MRNKANVINTIPPTTDYPFGRIKDDTGVNDGTPIVEENNGDIQETVTGFMQRAKITPNNLPDNVTNGYQIMDAIREVGGKFDIIHNSEIDSNDFFTVDCRLDNVYLNEFLISKFTDTNDKRSVAGITKIIDSEENVYDARFIGDFQNNFYDIGRYIIQREANDFVVYAIATTSVLNNIYERLETLELDDARSMRIVEKGTYTDETSRASGLVTIPHNIVDVENTKVFYTCTRANPMTSILSSNFNQIMIDRTINQIRIAFSDFPVDSYADKLKIDWWIVRS